MNLKPEVYVESLYSLLGKHAKAVLNTVSHATCLQFPPDPHDHLPGEKKNKTQSVATVSIWKKMFIVL